jgi:AsmA protein
MSKPVKIFVYIFSILVIFIIGLTVLIKTQITPEKVRETLLPMAEKQLQRKIEIGTIKVGIISGIYLTDLKVMQKDSKEEFFSIQEIGLHYQLLPLLMGKVVIDKVSLKKPKIFIVRLPNGQFNFSDLLPDKTEPGKVKIATPGHSPSTSKKLDLLVKEVTIEGGELSYVDRFKNSRSPFRYTLNQINFRARQITFDKSFPIDLSAMVNGANIDFSGNYDISQKTGDLVIHLAPLDVLPFAPYYRASLPGKLGSARLALELEVDLQAELLASKGKVIFDDIDLALDEFPDMKLKKGRLEVNYAVKFDTEKEQLQVSTLLLDFNGIRVGAEGQFDFSTAEPYMVSTIFLQQLDLRDVMKTLPDQLARDYHKYSLAGIIDGQIDFSGKLNSGAALFKSAQLNLAELRVSLGDLRAGVTGDVGYADNIFQTDNLLLQYGDQELKLKTRVEKGADNIFRGKFKLSAKELNINRIIPPDSADIANSTPATEPDVAATKSGRTAVTTPAVPPKKTFADDIGPFNIPAELQGTIAIKRLIYNELNIDQISADTTLKNNKLSISNLTANIGKGDVQGFSLVNLGVQGLTYQGTMTLNQANITTLVSGLFPEVKQNISGTLNWQNEFSGRGTLPDTLLPELKLKGSVAVQQGTVEGLPVLDELADFLGSNKLKVLSFQSLTAQYNLYDGLTRVNSNLDSSKTKLISTGTVAADGRLNFNLDALFAPEVLKKMGLKKKLRKSIADQDGWGTLPLLIRGTLDHPKVSYDSVALQDQMVDKASQKLLEKLTGKNDEKSEPIKKLLNKTLDKLFKK